MRLLAQQHKSPNNAEQSAVPSILSSRLSVAMCLPTLKLIRFSQSVSSIMGKTIVIFEKKVFKLFGIG